MKDNERIKAEAVVYHKGKLQGRIQELEELSEWISNFSEPDVELIVLHIAQRLKELK